jgi:hypothetical protein
LARQYNIEGLIRPLLDLDTGGAALPQAPKHVTAAPTKSKKKIAAEAAAAAAAAEAAAALYGSGDGGRLSPTPGASPFTQLGGQMGGLGGGGTMSGGAGPKGEMSLSLQQGMDLGGVRGMTPQGNEDRSMDDESLSASPSDASSSSRTPSPIEPARHHLQQQLSGANMQMHDGYMMGGQQMFAGQKRKAEDGYGAAGPSSQRQRMDADGGMHLNMGQGQGEAMQQMQGVMDMSGMQMGQSIDGGGAAATTAPVGGYMNPQIPRSVQPTAPDTYANIILDYFITEKARIPDILTEPPRDFDPNVPIDDDGHTALHWACAMGRLRVVKLLLTAGADIFRVNHSEQTALMRSVMFSNNYDVRKFPELYQLLHRSTLNIDKSNRTVFHHIADVALSKGKTHAARYYMETILAHLEDFPRELEDVINFQDEDGETALTLAARARSKRLVKALLDHGANPKLPNRDGKSAEDYILEDERFRSSPYIGAKLLGGDEDVSGVMPITQAFAPQLYHSEAAQQAAGRYTTEMSGMLDSLAQSFDSELQRKEKDVVRSDGLLSSLKADISETRQQLEEITQKTAPLEAELTRLKGLEMQLEEKMAQRYLAGWNAYLAQQIEKTKRWEQAGRPDSEEYRDVRQVIIGTEERGESPEMVEARLRSEIEVGQQERLAFFKLFVKQQAEVSTA